MIILGIDPSLVESGYCILQDGNILDSGTIKTNAKDEYMKRLSEIYSDVQSLCDLHHPDVLAIETQYLDLTKVSNSILKTVEAKALMIGAFWSKCLNGRVFEVHPKSVKSMLGLEVHAKRDEAKKASVWYVTHTLGIATKNNNITDAILIALYSYNLCKYDYPNTRRVTNKT